MFSAIYWYQNIYTSLSNSICNISWILHRSVDMRLPQYSRIAPCLPRLQKQHLNTSKCSPDHYSICGKVSKCLNFFLSRNMDFQNPYGFSSISRFSRSRKHFNANIIPYSESAWKTASNELYIKLLPQKRFFTHDICSQWAYLARASGHWVFNGRIRIKNIFSHRLSGMFYPMVKSEFIFENFHFQGFPKNLGFRWKKRPFCKIDILFCTY